MIQINLLPDIKRDFIKAQRTKRLFITISMLVSAAFLVFVFLMGSFVYIIQGQHSSNLQRDIDNRLTELQSVDNLDKILTVQNQLVALEDLHEQSPEVSRLFEYFQSLIPANIGLSEVTLNFSGSSTSSLDSLEISGVGKDFRSVNVFVDSLKNAVYTYEGSDGLIQAFYDVTLEAIGKNDVKTSFTVTTVFDISIFDSSIENIKLTVPSITSSPSVTERPFTTNQSDGGQ